MINDAQEYFVTKYWVDGFNRTLNHILAGRPGETEVNPANLAGEAKMVQTQIAQLRQQMADYEATHAEELAQLAAQPFAELAYALLSARLRLGIDPEVLAERLDVTEEQIIEYERTNYASATIKQVGDVINALGLTLHEEVRLPELVQVD